MFLNRSGYDDILAFNSASQVIAAANECDGGIVLCGYRLTDMHYSELYGYLPPGISDAFSSIACQIAGMLNWQYYVLVMPIHSHELVSTIETMAMELYAAEKKKEKIPAKETIRKRTKIN